jgi:hypothetical protein
MVGDGERAGCGVAIVVGVETTAAGVFAGGGVIAWEQAVMTNKIPMSASVRESNCHRSTVATSS